MSIPAPSQIAIAVVEQDGRVLVGRRRPDVPLPGMWEFPGGKVGPGETPAEAAARECREETGLQVRVNTLYETVVHHYPHARLELHFFACQPIAGPAAAPANGFRWVAATGLLDYEFPPANRSVVRLLAARARGAEPRVEEGPTS